MILPAELRKYEIEIFKENEPEHNEHFEPEKEDNHIDADGLTPTLKNNLDGIKRDFLDKNNDYLIVISGREGAGKSSLGILCGLYFDKNFSEKNIAFEGRDFLKLLKTLPDGSVIMWDEAVMGAYNRNSMTKLNVQIATALMVSRIKRMLLIVILPSFFMLDKYIRMHRVGLVINLPERAVYHLYSAFEPKIYSSNAKPWQRLSKIKQLAILGSHFWDYGVTRPNCKGRFSVESIPPEIWEPYMVRKREFVNRVLEKALEETDDKKGEIKPMAAPPPPPPKSQPPNIIPDIDAYVDKVIKEYKALKVIK